MTEQVAEYVDGGKPEGEALPSHLHGRNDQQGAGDEVDIRELWRGIVESRRWILSVTVLTTFMATIAAFVMTPVYRAEVLVASASDDDAGGISALAGRFGGLASLAGISLPGSGDSNSAIATLTSRQLVSRFIREKNLKPFLYDDDWDAEAKKWEEPSAFVRLMTSLGRSSQNVGTTEKLAPGEPSLWESTSSFLEDNLSVSQDSKTSLIIVTVEWKDPELAAEWANEIVARANDELRQRAIEESQRSVDYLNDQIRQTSVADLRNVLFGLIEEHTKTMTIAKTNGQYAFRVIDPAVPPEKKSRPNRPLIVALGMVFGLLVGLVVVMFRQGANKSRIWT